MTEKLLRLSINLAAELPAVPSFLRVQVDSKTHTVPLCATTEDELRTIGTLWTEALIEKSRQQAAKIAEAKDHE